jgi:hypothetical protein
VTDLQKLIDEAMARFKALTPTQQEAHRRLQAESWVRAERSWPKPHFSWINGVKVYHSYEDYCND